LEKAEFNSKVSLFFSNYLIGRKTQYRWNEFTSSFFSIDVSVSQGSMLSSIFSAFYRSLIFHIFEKKLKTKKFQSHFSLL